MIVEMNESLSFSAPTTKNVTTTSAAIVAANLERTYLCITNLSTDAIYLAVGDNAAVVGSGIPILTAGSTYEFIKGQNMTRLAINAIHGGSGNKAVAIQEAVGLATEEAY